MRHSSRSGKPWLWTKQVVEFDDEFVEVVVNY